EERDAGAVPGRGRAPAAGCAALTRHAEMLLRPAGCGGREATSGGFTPPLAASGDRLHGRAAGPGTPNGRPARARRGGDAHEVPCGRLFLGPTYPLTSMPPPRSHDLTPPP